MNDNKLALVIEDSVSVRRHVTSILRENEDVGDILEAGNADEALRLLMEHDGKLQFIVSNCDLPGMPLSEFLQVIECQPRLAGAPLLLLVEEGRPDAGTAAKEVGATAMVTMPPDPERLLLLTMAVTGTADRRRAKRIRSPIACEMTLGHSKSKKSYSATVVNISDSGVLLRAPIPLRGAGYIYDTASLALQPARGEPIKVPARILRIEADGEDRAAESNILMALEYGMMDTGARKALRRYLQMYDPDPDDVAAN
jgi:two-component system chemotaxis response regulator CheY